MLKEINDKSHLNYLLIFVIIIIGYFQISFFIQPLKFDALYVHFPLRFIIVDHIRNGYLPLWNFFQNIGLPIHSDPQSGAWYPIVWLFSLFGEYSLYMFNIEYILHLCIGAFGIYRLLLNLNIENKTSSIFSIIYVFTGFYTGHAAHFTWIISAAWIPWVINYFYLILKTPNIKYSLLLAFVMYMLISGGYPSFYIVLIYILSIWLLIFYIKNKKDLKRQTLYILLSAAITIIISSVFLFSVISSINYITRGNGITYNYASDLAINFKTLLSFLLPFSTVSTTNEVYKLFGTDISMSNFFIGIIPLIFSIYGLFKRKFIFTLLPLALLFLLLCFGDKFFLHKFLFDFILGFHLFRFPSFYRYYLILILLIASAFVISSDFNKMRLKSIFYLVLLIISLFSFYSLFNIDFSKYDFHDIYKTVLNFDVFDRIFINSIIEIPILIMAIIALKYTKNSNQLKNYLYTLMIIEVIIGFQLYAPYTVYPYKANLSESQRIINKKPNFLQLPQNQSIYKNSQINKYPFDRGLNVYEYKVSYKGNFSFLLNSTSQFFKTNDINSILDKPLLQFSENLNDTNYLKSTDINLIDFNQNSIKVKIKCNNSGYLKLIQNDYNGWCIYVNDKPTEKLLYLNTFMAVKINKGENIVEFVYQPKYIYLLFYISLFSFIIVALILIYFQIKPTQPQH